jgi:hypothetical protein
MKKIKLALGLSPLMFFGATTAFGADLSTSTVTSDIIQPATNQLLSVAGSVLPVVIGAGVLIALVYVGYRWFKKFTGVHK